MASASGVDFGVRHYLTDVGVDICLEDRKWDASAPQNDVVKLSNVEAFSERRLRLLAEPPNL